MVARDTVTLELSRDDLGQLAEALDSRIDQWCATREYLKNGTVAEFIEECHDVAEAEYMVAKYRNIQLILHDTLEKTKV